MRTTHRRYWVFFLLFLFSAIAYAVRSPGAVNIIIGGFVLASGCSNGARSASGRCAL